LPNKLAAHFGSRRINVRWGVLTDEVADDFGPRCFMSGSAAGRGGSKVGSQRSKTTGRTFKNSWFNQSFGPVAQRLEQATHNPRMSSSPNRTHEESPLFIGLSPAFRHSA